MADGSGVNGDFDRVEDVVPADASVMGNAKQLFDCLIGTFGLAISLRVKSCTRGNANVENAANVLKEDCCDLRVVVRVEYSRESMVLDHVLMKYSAVCWAVSCLLVGHMCTILVAQSVKMRRASNCSGPT